MTRRVAALVTAVCTGTLPLLPGALAQDRFCPDLAPLATAACTPIESWEGFVNSTKWAPGGVDGARLVLCPFYIKKGGLDPMATFKRQIVVVCQRRKEGDECLVEGPRTHVVIEGPRAEVTLVGMTFRGATKAAIKVSKTANKRSQTFCGCHFDDNRRSGRKRNIGGAVVATRGTRTIFSGCTFVNNFAKEGSAIQNQGRMEIFDSTFESNSGEGSIVDSRKGSQLTLEGNSFTNKGKEWWAVSVQTATTSWIDVGGNLGSKKSICSGFYDSTTKSCTEFGDEPMLALEPPQIRTDKETYPYGRDIVVSFTSPGAEADNWIAIVPSGSVKNGRVSDSFINWDGGWQEPCGASTCMSAVTEGSLVFKGLNPGEFQVVILESSIEQQYPVKASSDVFTMSTPPFREFVPGRLSTRDYETGLVLADGLSVQLLARVGYRVRFTSPRQTRRSESAIPFHGTPDGAGVFSRVNGEGWIYMSNSEEGDGRGGVFAVYFDAEGNIEDYQQRLGRTTRNCAGGKTPWGSWISCEEHSYGQCWQCDPEGRRSPERTNLVERSGGNFETVAVDDRARSKIAFFTTEDHEYGALRRFRPNPANVGRGWDMLHMDGILDYLKILPGGRYTWTRSLDEGRASARSYFPYSEGIDVRNGKLYFVAKKIKVLLALDLDRMTYRTERTDNGALMKNGGYFFNDPDQIISLSGKYIYFTEDGGSTPGVYVRDLVTGHYFTLFEADGFEGDETTGIAFSPDGKVLYCCLQRSGMFFAIRRKDNTPFEGTALSLRFHKMRQE